MILRLLQKELRHLLPVALFIVALLGLGVLIFLVEKTTR